MSGARHYNNLVGRRPFGSDLERLEVYSEQMGRVHQWPKVYVEGIPTNELHAMDTDPRYGSPTLELDTITSQRHKFDSTRWSAVLPIG